MSWQWCPTSSASTECRVTSRAWFQECCAEPSWLLWRGPSTSRWCVAWASNDMRSPVPGRRPNRNWLCCPAPGGSFLRFWSNYFEYLHNAPIWADWFKDKMRSLFKCKWYSFMRYISCQITCWSGTFCCDVTSCSCFESRKSVLLGAF